MKDDDDDDEDDDGVDDWLFFKLEKAIKTITQNLQQEWFHKQEFWHFLKFLSKLLKDDEISDSQNLCSSRIKSNIYIYIYIYIYICMYIE